MHPSTRIHPHKSSTCGRPPCPHTRNVPSSSPLQLWDTRYAVRPLQAACPGDASTPGRRSPRTSSGNAAACPYPPASSPLSASSLSSPSACGRAVPSSGDHKRGGERSGRGAGVGVGDRVSGGEVVAEEIYSGGGRPYGVSSVHACDDGSRIAVSAGARAPPCSGCIACLVFPLLWRSSVGGRRCSLREWYLGWVRPASGLGLTALHLCRGLRFPARAASAVAVLECHDPGVRC